jgi:hypothetical protein
MNDKALMLVWDIQMYRNLMVIYKDKEYLPSYFGKCLEVTERRYTEFFIHRQIDQFTEDNSTLIKWKTRFYLR